jgi:hypothetical protein
MYAWLDELVHEIVCRACAARKDYCAHWNLDSRQQAREGRERAIATEGRTCSAKTRGKADQKRGLALGHITPAAAGNQPCGQSFSLGLLHVSTVYVQPGGLFDLGAKEYQRLHPY